MESRLWSLSCDPTCGFAVQSHEKDEVINLTFEHISHAHPEKKMTREQLESMIAPYSFCR